MEPIRVLYVYGGIMSRGGTESFMMNYYRNFDKSKVQVDFVVHGFEKGVYDDEIESMGGEIYHVPVKSKDYFGNAEALRKIFNSGKYEIVHSHMDAMSMVVLKLARQCDIPVRIAHSHNTQHLTNNKIKFMLNEYARKKITKYATHLCACTEDAGRWLFGNKALNDKKVILMNNAIELDNFAFSLQKRNVIREQLGLKENFVIGHIGRFDYQKNHMFLLEIFKATLGKKPDAKLLLIGDGHLREQIKERIEQLGIKKSVVMLGLRDDVNDLLNAFDLLLLPSLFEGLGIVLIEAQTNGLRCIVSHGVPQAVNITNLVSYKSLDETAIHWADQVNQLENNSNEREGYLSMMSEGGYGINIEAPKLMNLYISLIKDQ